MKSRHIAIVLAVGVVLLALTYSPSAWAGSGQYQSGCGGTVPCRTKVPTPVQVPTEVRVGNTPTPVPPTLPVGITPVVVVSATAVPILLTDAAMITPALSAEKATPTVSTALPSVAEAATRPPLLASTQAFALLASDTPVPLSTLPPTRETAASNGNWLLWVAGLILIAGGAALVFVRSSGQTG